MTLPTSVIFLYFHIIIFYCHSGLLRSFRSFVRSFRH